MGSEDEPPVVDEAALRRDLEEMAVTDLLSCWDDEMSVRARELLHAELSSRGVRVSTPKVASESSGSPDLPDPPHPPESPTMSPKVLAEEKIAGAVRWILAISILCVVLGVIFGVLEGHDIAVAEEALAERSGDETVVIDGEEWVVSAFREQLARERYSVFAGPISMGLVFLGLYFWGLRSPLPAMFAALVLFVGMQVALIVNPVGFAAGLRPWFIFTILLVYALVRGIKDVLFSEALNAELALLEGAPSNSERFTGGDDLAGDREERA